MVRSGAGRHLRDRTQGPFVGARQRVAHQAGRARDFRRFGRLYSQPAPGAARRNRIRADRKESTKLSLKCRRGKGEILIVSPAGRGWWDPTSDAKGDVFKLVQRLEPGLTYGHVRKRLRQFAGLSPSFPPAERARRGNNLDLVGVHRHVSLSLRSPDGWVPTRGS